jgi:GNAT superfamily N-acetyltransferase
MVARPIRPDKQNRATRQGRLEADDSSAPWSHGRLFRRIAGMIRPARPDDVPQIALLIRELARYEKLEEHVVLVEAELREHLFGPRPYIEVLMAEDDASRQVVGFALFFHSYSTFLGKPGIYLEDLFVRPEHRGRGFGKALLVSLARLAVERGCGRLDWAVLNWNAPSIAFYERMGAQPMNEWTTYRLTGDSLKRLAQSA